MTLREMQAVIDAWIAENGGYWSELSLLARLSEEVGEVSCGPGIDQDVAIWTTQQKGLRSRGYRGDYMPWQERRIRYFHDTIDRYLDLGPA